jgi:hypothetical protein
MNSSWVKYGAVLPNKKYVFYMGEKVFLVKNLLVKHSQRSADEVVVLNLKCVQQ